MRVKLYVLIETNDHDGYCSGDECVYETDIKKIICDLPNHLIDDCKTMNTIPCWMYDWKKEIKSIENETEKHLNLDGSGYCKDNTDVTGMAAHDCRVKVVKAKVL